MSNLLNAEEEHMYLTWQKNRRRGKVATGLIVIAFGTLFLLRGLGVALPDWLFSWPLIVISIGLIIVIKHKFKTMAGYLLMLIGTLFLFHHWYPEIVNLKVVWPILIILVGFGIIFKSRFKGKKCRGHRDHHHRFHRERWKKHEAFFEEIGNLEDVSQDDFIDAVSIFGGVQKNVVSKQFRGADIVTIFGGNEINLSQADFTDKVVMDVTNIFGGTTLTVPNNWQIKSEIVVLFGDVEDKRPKNASVGEGVEKVVILKGTCLFGGIEINSYNS